jgi:hypothetical protein
MILCCNQLATFNAARVTLEYRHWSAPALNPKLATQGRRVPLLSWFYLEGITVLQRDLTNFLLAFNVDVSRSGARHPLSVNGPEKK